jgi:23S rRNA (uracil1939-C5)-methyltransferase
MRCQHFGACGGCSLPGVPYPEQLASKSRDVSAAVGGPVLPIVPCPVDSGFRHKVAFVFDADARGRLVMGHYAAGSRRVVPVVECPVHSARGNRLAFALRDRLAHGRIDPHLLRHIIVRTTADGRSAVVMLVVWRNDRALRAPIRQFLASDDRPDGFFVNVHDTPGPFMVGRTTLRIDGHAHVRETALGPTFLISPTTFFQTNVIAAGEVLARVLEWAGGARDVLDLYSGVGLFTVPLAMRGMRVTTVEENAQAVRDLEANLRVNHVGADRVRAITGRVEDALNRLPRTPVDAVVLDPPRQGCAPAVLDHVFGRLRPSRAVYVSCDPASLAADLVRIRAAGYRVGRVQPVDMFPHTKHVETVVELTPDHLRSVRSR